MKDICKHLNIDTKKYKEKTFLNAISNAKNELKTPEQFAEETEKEYNRRIFGRVYKEYQKRLKQNNALDFDDLIMKTVELFKDQTQVLEEPFPLYSGGRVPGYQHGAVHASQSSCLPLPESLCGGGR